MTPRKASKAKKAAKAPRQALTPKREKFAQLVATGKSGADAYRGAFNVRASTKAETVQQGASRLLADRTVAARLAVLRANVVKKVEITVQSLNAELEEARALALAEKQSSAAVSATMGKAKLAGLIVDKHKHSGSIGTYDLSKISDADLNRLETILGPLADDGGDTGGEG